MSDEVFKLPELRLNISGLTAPDWSHEQKRFFAALQFNLHPNNLTAEDAIHDAEILLAELERTAQK
jgi:hypothetical protein